MSPLHCYTLLSHIIHIILTNLSRIHALSHITSICINLARHVNRITQIEHCSHQSPPIDYVSFFGDVRGDVADMPTQQTRDIEPMVGQFLASVVDDGPTLTNTWVDVSCLLWRLRSADPTTSIRRSHKL